MTPKQIVRARDIAQTHGMKTFEVIDEVMALAEGDYEGKGAKTIDQALEFINWALSQPQGETENE